MTGKDDATIGFYRQNADAYTSTMLDANHRDLEPFLQRLAPGATILELGCGSGKDSAFMLARGFDVHPTDGTPEITEAAQARLGVPVRQLLFDDLDEHERYDGIWANACLLHVPRPSLSGIVGRIHRALKPAGVFHASFKAGNAEGRDGLGRYFNYPSSEWLTDVYAPYSWTGLVIDTRQGSGYDNEPTEWLHITAIKA